MTDVTKLRLPPGQIVTRKWPVLHYGTVPNVDLATWRFRVRGAVERPFEIGWEELNALPKREVACDIHCVTRWSRYDNVFGGVPVQELLARVHALLRRAYPSEEKKQLSFPPFDIDIQRGEVRRDGTKVELTPKEFELTVTLFRNIGRLLSRGHLQESVWGRTGDLATRTVDTHVSQVRKKLDLRPDSGYRVVPIYNYGYRLEKISPGP